MMISMPLKKKISEIIQQKYQTSLHSQSSYTDELLLKYAETLRFLLFVSSAHNQILKISRKSLSVKSRNLEMRIQWLRFVDVSDLRSLVHISFIVENTRSTSAVDGGINAAYSSIRVTTGCFEPNP